MARYNDNVQMVNFVMSPVLTLEGEGELWEGTGITIFHPDISSFGRGSRGAASLPPFLQSREPQWRAMEVGAGGSSD